MNNNVIYAWLAGLTMLFSIILFFQFSGGQKLVYIDSNKLLAEYQGMKDAQLEFQQKSKKWQTNIDTLMAEVQNSIMNYEKESSKMSPKEKQLSHELIKTKQRQLTDYQRAIREQSEQKDHLLTQQVLIKVNSFLTDYGKRNNYSIIFGATSAGNIIYADDGMDITDEVIKLLNDQYQSI